MPDQTNQLDQSFTPVKSLGFYPNAELETPLEELGKVIDNKGLITNQQIILRINQQTTNAQLTTASEPETNYSPEQQEKLLFLKDYLVVLTGLAKAIHQLYPTDTLGGFGENYDELTLLKEWGTGEQAQFSERELEKNFFRIRELYNTVALVFDQYKKADERSEDADQDTELDPAAVAAATTTASQGSRRGITQSSDDSSQEDSGEDLDPPDLTDPTNKKIVSQQVEWVVFFAQRQLILDAFEKAGFSMADLPPDIQDRINQLTDLLREQVYILIQSLPPDKLNQLLTQQGAVVLRAQLFRDLIQKLLADTQLQFFEQLTEIYQQVAQQQLATNSPEAAAAFVQELESVFATPQFRDATFDKIREYIRAWKARFIKSLEQKVQPDQPRPASQEPERPTHFRPLPSTVQNALDTAISSAGTISPEDQKSIQDQGARLYWGTMAELFRDKDIQDLSGLPNTILDQVQSKTLAYIMSLPPEERERVRRSPSSLIRHIKNNSGSILGGTTFQQAYNSFISTHNAPVLSRAEQLETETTWAYNQLHFQLFGVHDIDDESTPDEPGLQDVFDELKFELYETSFQFFEELPADSLEKLYIIYPDREKILSQLRARINQDPAFINKLSQFYNNLLQHLSDSDQHKYTQLQNSINHSLVQAGVVFKLRDSEHITQRLFGASLQDVVDTDDPLLIKTTSSALDSLLLSYGYENTSKLINNINPQMLALTFGIEEGKINEANIDQFRSLLDQFAASRFAQLSALSNLQPHGLFGSEKETKYDTISSTQFTKRVENVRHVQQMVQDQDGEVVAEAVGKTDTRKKAQIFFKIFEREWNSLGQVGQKAVYAYYDIPIPQRFEKAADADENLPLILEFIDFQEKRASDQTLLKTLVSEYERGGADEFDPLLKAEFQQDVKSAEERIIRVEQLRASLSLVLVLQMEEADKAEAALAAGYANAVELETAIKAQLQENQVGQLMQQAQSIPGVVDLQVREQARAAQQEPGVVNSLMSKLRGKTSPKGKLSNAIQVANQTKQLTNAGSTAKKISTLIGSKGKLAALGGGAAALAIGGGVLLLQNKQFREAASAVSTYFVASTLHALSTVGGLAGSTLFYFSTLPFLGPIGALGAGFFGAHMGAQIAPWSWGNMFGFSPNQPPPMSSIFSSSSDYVNPSQASMSALRDSGATQAAATTAAAQNAAASSASTGAAAGQSALGTTTATAPAAATTGAATAGTTAAAGTSGGLSGWLSGLSISVTAPLIATISMGVLTIFTITVIIGAFLVPTPTRIDQRRTDELTPATEGTRFIDLEKQASVQQIENNTPTEVAYSISVAPKSGFSIRVTDIEDDFMGFGTDGVTIESPISGAVFPDEPFSDPQVIDYTVTIGENLADIAINNVIQLTFDVIDINGFTAQRDQTLASSAAVRVGEPKQGCWPASGEITWLPASEGGHTNFKEDAFDISNVAGSPIFSPFDGQACSDTIVETRPGRTNTGQYIEYGLYVKLAAQVGGQTHNFIFAHMRATDIASCSEGGQPVTSGQTLGEIGNTGNSSGNHLHYELKSSGRFIKNFVPDGQDVVNRYNGGETVMVNHCF
ncbi:MAG: M23 family metallopeptidase [Patescibacteria group bacterium]